MRRTVYSVFVRQPMLVIDAVAGQSYESMGDDGCTSFMIHDCASRSEAYRVARAKAGSVSAIRLRKWPRSAYGPCASEATLVSRVRYGGRKGRAALRRLAAEHSYGERAWARTEDGTDIDWTVGAIINEKGEPWSQLPES